jgi:cytidylate kinase
MSVASNPELDFDDFINYADEHPELLKEFDEALIAESKRKSMLTDKTKKKAKDKK